MNKKGQLPAALYLLTLLTTSIMPQDGLVQHLTLRQSTAQRGLGQDCILFIVELPQSGPQFRAVAEHPLQQKLAVVCTTKTLCAAHLGWQLQNTPAPVEITIAATGYCVHCMLPFLCVYAAVWDSFRTLRRFWLGSFASSAVDLRAHR